MLPESREVAPEVDLQDADELLELVMPKLMGQPAVRIVLEPSNGPAETHPDADLPTSWLAAGRPIRQHAQAKVAEFLTTLPLLQSHLNHHDVANVETHLESLPC